MKWFLFLFTSLHFAFAQQVKLNWSVEMDSTSIWDYDGLGNIILVQNNEIQKLNENGVVVRRESIKSFGDLAQIDASLGLKIAVYSQAQQQVCFLDNNLSLQNECLDFNAMQLEAVSSFCMSNQSDRIWVYNDINSELLQISTNNKTTQLSQKISNLTSPLAGNVKLKMIDNYLSLETDSVTLYFDMYGTYLGDFPPQSIVASEIVFQLKNNQLYRVINEKIELLFTFDESEKLLFAVYAQNKVYVQSNSKLHSLMVIQD